MFGSPEIGYFATSAPQERCLRFRISGLRGARFADRRGRTKPAQRKVSAFSRAGQAGDLHVHARRAQPGRYVRLQAHAGEILGSAGPLRRSAAADGPRKKKTPLLRETPWKFAQHGQSGRWVSELFPHVARHVDDLCVINSMHTEGRAHGEATLRLHTGTANFVRPSLGSWVTYGLGTENSNLPGFITIAPPRSRRRAKLFQRVSAGHLSRNGDRHGRRPGEGRLDPFLSNDKLSPRCSGGNST